MFFICFKVCYFVCYECVINIIFVWCCKMDKFCLFSLWIVCKFFFIGIVCIINVCFLFYKFFCIFYFCFGFFVREYGDLGGVVFL